MCVIVPRDVSSYSYAGTGYANPHAVTGIGYTGGATTTYVYDSNGNLTSDGTYTYIWDYQNRLTEVGNVSGTTTYAYDHMGNRVKKVEGGITTLYPNKLYNVTTESTPTATKHIFADESLVATAETSGCSGGSITLDATSTNISTGFVAGPVTKTWTHTVSGSNPVIVLAADIFQDVAGTGAITSATWNGGAFTKASSTRTGTKSAEMWYLVATTTGAKTMSVTVTGATDALKLMSASFNGVHQSSPLDAVNTAGGARETQARA